MNKAYITHLMLNIGVVMVILIIALGAYILFSPSLNYWPKYSRTIFALVILGYGFYRSVNIFHNYKKKEERQ
jgi:cadmium resistance protein CadD (predicted permease)